MTDILSALSETLEARKSASPDESYVASLHAKGINKILEKVGEEATEVILAAKDAVDPKGKHALIGEVADLWFHTMVLMSHLELRPEEVVDRLGERFNLSGLEEKASRTRDNSPPEQPKQS